MLGVRQRSFDALVRDVPVPRTSAVAAAESALAGAEPWVLAHSMRTYLFGAMLGTRDGLRPDAEVLLLASLLHDIGLVHREGAACFAFRGAQQARAIVGSADGERVAEAICAHLNVLPSPISVEAALLRAGAGLDVAADRFDHLSRGTRRDVVRTFPREGFARSVTAALRAEASAHPGTRAAFLCGALGFLRLIAQADRRFEQEARS